MKREYITDNTLVAFQCKNNNNKKRNLQFDDNLIMIYFEIYQMNPYSDPQKVSRSVQTSC